MVLKMMDICKNRLNEVGKRKHAIFWNLLVIVGILAYINLSFIVVLHDPLHEDHDARSLNEYDILSSKTTGRTQQYTSALTLLRCFATPGCFPNSQCHTGVPRKVQRRKKWEEQSFCVDDLTATNKSCLVYSFGIHESYEWEEKVAKKFGCEVHAFDPTMNHKTNLAPGVTFHKLGLQADGTNMARTHAAEYDAIDPKLLLSLDQIMRKLGHEGRSLDLLMMDCEGCEWGVLHKLACSKLSHVVKQIVVEFHFQSNLGLETKSDVEQAAEAVQCLWDERWHITSIEQSGSGRENWEYAPGVLSILHSEGMLLYVTLQRIPENQPTPAQLLGELISVGHELGESYGTANDVLSSWTPELRSKLTPLIAKSTQTQLEYLAIAAKSVAFNQWERIMG